MQESLIRQARTEGRSPTPRLPTCIAAAISASTAFINLVGGETQFASVRRAINHHSPRPSNCRLATIPGISHEILHTLLESPIEAIQADCERWAWILGEAHRVEVLTYDASETEFRLKLDLGGWEDEPLMSPGVILPGSWGNVPPGETFCCPGSASVHGKVCINGSVPGDVLGPGQELVLDFDKGRLVAWNAAERSPGLEFLKREQERALARDDNNWSTFAELGIGLNPTVDRLTGNALFDEKALGTIHVAIGDNSNFGGDVVSSIHLDMVTWRPTVRIDGQDIMNRGVVAERRIDSIRANRQAGEGDIPADSVVYLRKGKVGHHNGLLHRRLSKVHRIGFVMMADRHTSHLLDQVCDALTSFGRIHISRFLRDFPSFEDTPTPELLQILKHYGALGIESPGSAAALDDA